MKCITWINVKSSIIRVSMTRGWTLSRRNLHSMWKSWERLTFFHAAIPSASVYNCTKRAGSAKMIAVSFWDLKNFLYYSKHFLVPIIPFYGKTRIDLILFIYQGLYYFKISPLNNAFSSFAFLLRFTRELFVINSLCTEAKEQMLLQTTCFFFMYTLYLPLFRAYANEYVCRFLL